MPRRRGRRGDHACAMAIAVATAIASVGAAAAGGDSDAEFDYRRLSGIIIPGFASTQLRAWSVLDCPYSPFDFNPLDSVWIDTAKVSYNSFSWCKDWLGPKVNITRGPQAEYDGSDLQTRMNVEDYHGQDLFPNMTRAPHVKYITYYEDAGSIPGWRTAVWELDKANHRDIVRMPVAQY